MIVPAMFHETRKGRYEISIEYPEILTPRGPEATAFNRAARAIAFGKDAVSEYREIERPMAAGAENFYDVDYTIPYLDPRLASVVFTISTFTGGAHPNSARIALLFDLSGGRALRLAGVFADPKQAGAGNSAVGRGQLGGQGEKGNWGVFQKPRGAAGGAAA